MRSPELSHQEQSTLAALAPRLGPLHVQRRLGLERDYEARIFRRGTHFFHLENWYSIHSFIRSSLRLAGLHGRGRRNALAIQVRENEIVLPMLPRVFDGYTLLQLTDLHVDMSRDFVHALIERVRTLDYDLCVLTGDYRARTFGPFQPALDGLERLRVHLKNTAYAVFGNHDSIRMLPGMEAMGYRLLMNECVELKRDGSSLFLAGIDDAHYYCMENFQRASQSIPAGACSILLSHTPEAYQRAADAKFSLMLSGHTHGGQICLPGGMPIIIDADCPRAMARGAWKYQNLTGYTSAGAGSCIVDVRLNCPPEITLHRLVSS